MHTSLELAAIVLWQNFRDIVVIHGRSGEVAHLTKHRAGVARKEWPFALARVPILLTALILIRGAEEVLESPHSGERPADRRPFGGVPCWLE